MISTWIQTHDTARSCQHVAQVTKVMLSGPWNHLFEVQRLKGSKPQMPGDVVWTLESGICGFEQVLAQFWSRALGIVRGVNYEGPACFSGHALMPS